MPNAIITRTCLGYNDAVTLEEAVKQIQDALVVYSAMTLKHEERLKEHQAWLEANERALAQHREFLLGHAAIMEAVDRKLDRIAELILHGQGGNGH